MVDYEVLRDTGAGIFQVLAKAKALEREGKKILHFEIGQPDQKTPEHIKQAAKDALDANFTGYVPSSGIQDLKEAIQEEIEKTRGFSPSLNQILVLPGANSGVYFGLRAVIEKLIAGEKLDPQYRDHQLSGNWKGHRYCHIESDWILIYRITADELYLERTGSHSALFKK